MATEGAKVRQKLGPVRQRLLQKIEEGKNLLDTIGEVTDANKVKLRNVSSALQRYGETLKTIRAEWLLVASADEDEQNHHDGEFEALANLSMDADDVYSDLENLYDDCVLRSRLSDPVMRNSPPPTPTPVTPVINVDGNSSINHEVSDASNGATSATQNLNEQVLNASAESSVEPPVKSDQVILSHQQVQQEMINMMARASLPDCEPTHFNDDKTKYFSWKSEMNSFVLTKLTKASEKLTYIQKYTHERSLARSMVSPYVKHGTQMALDSVWARLDSVFGNPAFVIKAHMEKLKTYEPIEPKQVDKLLEFSSLVNIMLTDLDSTGHASLLDTDDNIKNVLVKLPIDIITGWERYCFNKFRDNDIIPFSEICKFLENQAMARSNPRFGRDEIIREKNKSTNQVKPKSPKFPQKRTLATQGQQPNQHRRNQQSYGYSQSYGYPQSYGYHDSKDQPRSGGALTHVCQFCNRSNHNLKDCFLLQKCDNDMKISFFQCHHICFKCGASYNNLHVCKSVINCRVCQGTHLTVFHSGSSKPTTAPTAPDTSHGEQRPRMENRNSDEKSQTVESQSTQSTSTQSKSGTTLKASSDSVQKDWSHIIKVNVYSKDDETRKFPVYACVDGESNTSWITHDWAVSKNLLTPSTPQESMCLKTILSSTENSGLQPMSFSTVSKLCIESIDGNTRTVLPKLYVTNEIPATHENIPSPGAVKNIKHLRNIASQFPEVACEIPIVLLIGRNCAEAVGYIEIVPYPGNGQPCALRTSFGWSISHCVDENSKLCAKTQLTDCKTNAVGISPTSAILLENIDQNENQTDQATLLNRKILEYLERDFSDEDPADIGQFSQHDLLFLDKMRNSIELVNGHYQMELPFKGEAPILPNNRQYVVSRLLGQTKKILGNDEYRKDYTEFFRMMIDQGYLVEVPEEEQNPKTDSAKLWYIPHHGTYHPRKRKFRAVFDVPAKYKGESLNSYLLSGPSATLTGSLFGCLVRLRKDKVALMCDIEHMFNRCHVAPEHQDYFRVVWYDYNLDGSIDFTKIKDYKMVTHVFGAKSSPSCANFALKQTAKDNRDIFSEKTYEFVTDHFYVDDGCTSVPDSKSGIELSLETIQMLSNGGFNVHKFISNDRDLINALPAERRIKELVSVDINDMNYDLPENLALGLLWDPNKDVFKFHFNLPDQPNTRRGILSVIHSLYDPLGFLAPVILEARQILQELCQLATNSNYPLDWDDTLPPEIESRWEQWKAELGNLEKLEIPRSYIPKDFGTLKTVQIHSFGDASERGYGCCSFLRITNERDEIHVSFIAGKSRVCPTSIVTLPRKELVSAVLNTQVAKQVIRELKPDSLISTYPEIEEFYYTDSSIVLGYIANDSKQLKTFVANRATFINKNTDKSQWSHVRSENNPSDCASRGEKAENLSLEHQYLKGPNFLWQPEESWRPDLINCERFNLKDCDPERKGSVKVCNSISSTVNHAEIDKYSIEPCELLLELINRCSSLEIAKRRVCVVLKAVEKFKRLCKLSKPIMDLSASSVNEDHLAERLTKAQFLIIQHLQRSAFPSEFKQLMNVQHDDMNQTCFLVKTTIPELKELNPFYDAELGVLRVGGRLQNANKLSYSEKHPLIIPKDTQGTSLLIDYYHRKCNHQGFGITMYQVRLAGLWIIHGCSQVKKFLKNCVICRRLRSGELVQKMCDLPLERSLPGLFQIVGIDVFGPFEVAFKRGVVKRYGCVFVCFASRSIHIEKLYDMTTDRFINAMRRFINRRGNVTQFWCDRGSNFIGASNEISRALDEMDETKIKTVLATEYGSDYFRFGYPFSSHKNGHIERQIRTIRSVLNNILFKFKDRLDDDVLETFFVEVEGIVNSRPLSVMDLNDPHSTPIAPINILTQKSTVVTSLPGEYDKSDLLSMRKLYRRSQFLANEFWNEWKVKYLLDLQKRDKWFSRKRSLQIGDIVVMVDDTVNRNSWPLARVTNVTQDSDGLVRKVKIQVGDKNYDRPISKLRLVIPVEEQTGAC